MLNNELKNMTKPDNNTPYKYTNHGDSYFVSKNMYKVLMETCRCGREKTNGHILKCLQKQTESHMIKRDDNENNNCNIDIEKMPPTSSGKLDNNIFFFFNNKYFHVISRNVWLAKETIY